MPPVYPAWAGQPLPTVNGNRHDSVYPRVGGGNPDPAFSIIASSRSIPGVGGATSPGFVMHTGLDRSIPAWAGQPPRNESAGSRRPVYPRVGGATLPEQVPDEVDGGLSPRGRATQHACRQPFPPVGLSPRGRGNPGHGQTGLVPPGSIPAWAGQPY